MFGETVSPEAIEQLPLALFKGVIMEIRTSQEVGQALAELSKESLLGFDTETRPNFSPHPESRHKTALLQLASGHKAYLFRLPYCGIPIELAALLGNPKIVKVGAAIRDDIIGLQVYRTFKAAGFVDVQMMAESRGIKEKSLRKMAAIILQTRISKGQQLSNWENKELTEPQRRYAALDAWVCREIYLKLNR